MVSGTISLPLQGFFSTFPHGTSALSVTEEYLALARGQAGFMLGFTCPALLGIPLGCFEILRTGLSPSLAEFSSSFCYLSTIPRYGPATPLVQAQEVWAVSRSLAATRKINVFFFSSGY